MKKSSILFMVCAIAVMAEAAQVHVDDAAVVANHFMNAASTVSGANKAPAKRMVLKAPAQETENQYFVFENANGEGWVIVAADDVVRPILAYSETGHFRTDNMPENVKTWLHGYNRQITFAAQHSTGSAEVAQRWSALRSGARRTPASVVVAPLIQTGWNQGAPFWNMCPMDEEKHCYVGCVATAMAQVMNYHQWPIHGTGAHSVPYNDSLYTARFGMTTYDWDNMLDVYTGNYNQAQADAIATLMYHCGVAVDMEYTTSGSGAMTLDYNGYFSEGGIMTVETALPRFFGYEKDSLRGYDRDGWEVQGMRSWTREEWSVMLMEELDKARPLMYAGYGYEDPEDESTMYGHSFVCDGYDSDSLFHFNFGWSNWCDGYYDLDLLETHDPGMGGGNGYFSYMQNVLTGIVPKADTCLFTGITLDTVGVKTTFTTVHPFNSDNLVVWANYSSCERREVEPDGIIAPEMGQIGEYTVAVFYSEDGVSDTAYYPITIIEPNYYHVACYDRGELVFESDSVAGDTKVLLPMLDLHPDGYDRWTFVGWWTEPLEPAVTDKEDWLENPLITQDQNYYAVYHYNSDFVRITSLNQTQPGYHYYVIVGGGANALQNETFNNYYIAATPVTIHNDTIYNPSYDIVWRVYFNGHWAFFYNEEADSYLNVVESGDYHNLVMQDNYAWFWAKTSQGHWTFESNECDGWYLSYAVYKSTPEFTTNSDAPNNIQLYMQDPASSYYTTQPHTMPLGIDNTHTHVNAVKVFKNGQLLIRRGDTFYTLQGQELR